MDKLIKIQNELKAPKSNFNSFGKYSYRSCEDILEAAKPLLQREKMAIIFKDEIEHIRDRYYLKATVSLIAEDGKIVTETSALAREESEKKGMDGEPNHRSKFILR
jgi:hypothetical protein